MSTSSIALSRKGNLGRTTAAERIGLPRGGTALHERASLDEAGLGHLFLRIPPFAGAKVQAFECSPNSPALSLAKARTLVDKVRNARVGGAYWGAQQQMPDNYILVRSEVADEVIAGTWPAAELVRWRESGTLPLSGSSIGLDSDPWHALAGAAGLVAEPEDEAVLIAAILGVPVFSEGPGGMCPLEVDPAAALSAALRETYQNPFTGQPMSAEETVALCGFWRSLIDSNRGISAGLGFAFWKHKAVAPLLWDGGKPFEFVSSARDVAPGQAIAVWRTRAPVETIARLEEAGAPLVEVEDGFLRSQGLGADCVPPLSITVDALGAYFDPAQPSALEELLQNGEFDRDTLERARNLRSAILKGGLSKYGSGTAELARPAGAERVILVPGQVEDDRSVMTGGAGLSNRELLELVREDARGAYIIYKPHPDVLAGHRKGAIPRGLCSELADRIVDYVPIAALIDMVDEVHVNTSLTGFEALMRGKPVTTHGVPFYAGWGLTRDLGPVPSRRSASRTLDELVAASLLLYPRYLDPVTGLPCPAEIIVDRLCSGQGGREGSVVKLRRLQGKVLRRLRGIIQ